MIKIIDEAIEGLEEFGDAHGIDCACNMEEPDACDCEVFKAIRSCLTKIYLQGRSDAVSYLEDSELGGNDRKNTTLIADEEFKNARKIAP